MAMSRALQGAVEFLLMAGQMDQAFDIAMGHNEMDTFARIVAASAKPVRRKPTARTHEMHVAHLHLHHC